MRTCETCGAKFPTAFKVCPACIAVPLIEGEGAVPEIENHPFLQDWFAGEGPQ